MGLLQKLFKPRWMNAVDYVAVEGVGEVDDPETLRRVLAEAPSFAARVAALEKLDDQALYREVALTAEDPRLLEAAAKHLDDIETMEALDKRMLNIRGTAAAMDCARKRIRVLRHDALAAQLAEIPSMDDASRLVETAITDPKEDWFKPKDSRRTHQWYTPPHTIEDDLREAAVKRLAALGDDESLAEVIKTASDGAITSLAASSIRDKSILDRLILEKDLRFESKGAVISHMDNVDLLRELMKTNDPFEVIPAVCMKRLVQLPCIDGEDHVWVTVSEEDDDIYDEHRYSTKTKRCSKCGVEETTRTKIGYW